MSMSCLSLSLIYQPFPGSELNQSVSFVHNTNRLNYFRHAHFFLGRLDKCTIDNYSLLASFNKSSLKSNSAV